MPTFQLDEDVKLSYEDDDFTDPWRSAPVMLLQHGFSRNGRFWYNWVPLLGREFRLLRPDMRGMGRSTMPEEQYEPSLETFANDVRRLLDHLSIEQVVFVGESFGGIIGLKFAHTYPERTRALVLCNTPCKLPHGELRQRFAAGGDWDATLRRGVGAWSTATIDMRLDSRIAPTGLKAWYIAEMDRTSPTTARKLQAYLDTLDFSDHLKEIYAAYSEHLAHFNRLRALPVNHHCSVDEARQRMHDYMVHIEEGFALLTDEDLAWPFPTVFVPEGEALLTLLLGNLEPSSTTNINSSAT
jgi:3-oxoadipate enol-lactonase